MKSLWKMNEDLGPFVCFWISFYLYIDTMKLLGEVGGKKRADIRVMSGITGPQFCQIWRWSQNVRMKTGHRMETVLNFVFHVVDFYWILLIMAKIAWLSEDMRWIKLKLILLKWKEHVSNLVDAILPLTIIFSMTQLPWLDVKTFGSWMMDENGVSWDNWKMDGFEKVEFGKIEQWTNLGKLTKKWPRKFY